MPTNTLPILPGVLAHSSGALWLAASKAAIVADVHLGYSWAQRRRGELGPLVDFRTREKLFRLCDELRPEHLVFLGDLVHAPRPCAPEREWIEETLLDLSQRAEVIAVRGNHDRAFVKDFGHLNLRTVELWSHESITAVHGDRLICPVTENHTVVIGHLHPCLGVKDASGAAKKVPVFLVNSECIVLPAFSPFSRGYDVICGLPEELITCFGAKEIQAYAATGTRVVHLGPLHRAIERMYETDSGAPERFRGHRA